MLDNSRDLPPSDILITSQLSLRTQRSANLERETFVMKELVYALARSPDTILDTLVEKAMLLCGAGSAGISIDESENGEYAFKWHAVAGKLKPFLHAKLPRFFSPCGVVLDQNSVQLMYEPERFYPHVKDLGWPIHEVLLVPFYRDEKPIGTIWVIAHDKSKSFDAEDSRIMHSLAKFMSSAIETYKRMR